MNNEISFIPLGGIGDVTKNMYLYEYQNQILIVDCGLGFADESMLGVDLLFPDISYLVQIAGGNIPQKKIVGMLLTHGHEDHIGATPYVLPQLPQFPIYASPFTAGLTNEKLREFGIGARIQEVPFSKPTVSIGPFTATFIRVTHSVPDTSHIFIESPAGNFYHGSDYKFDNTPADGKISDYEKIKEVAKKGVLCLLSDCLGSERVGRTPTEITIRDQFEREMRKCRGKFIVTTYSSNVARLNQIIQASRACGRVVCFVGRSLIKTKEVAKKFKYLDVQEGTDIRLDELSNYPDHKITLVIAGSQGQENSAMSRIADGVHKEVKLTKDDTVVFSADPIPGNEKMVYELIDTLAKRNIRVVHASITRDFHVSGHGSLDELSELISLVKPKKLIPIGGNYRHMYGYRQLGIAKGYKEEDTLFLDDGREVIFSGTNVRYGKTIPVRNVYVDEISGEEVERFVLLDRQKLSEGGIVIVLAEIDTSNGQLLEKPDIIIRGFSLQKDAEVISRKLSKELQGVLRARSGRVINWSHVRKIVGETAERIIYKELKRRPLVLPVVIEV